MPGAREELEQLQLEEARQQALDRKTARDQKKNRVEAIEAALKRDRENQEAIQAACTHRKGGKGAAGIYRGQDSNFSVITHTFAEGITRVVCQRCGKKWEPPPPLAKKATPEQKAEYKAAYAEYRRALELPTDNEPSGTVLFAFSQPDMDAV